MKASVVHSIAQCMDCDCTWDLHNKPKLRREAMQHVRTQRHRVNIETATSTTHHPKEQRNGNRNGK